MNHLQAMAAILASDLPAEHKSFLADQLRPACRDELIRRALAVAPHGSRYQRCMWLREQLSQPSTVPEVKALEGLNVPKSIRQLLRIAA